MTLTRSATGALALAAAIALAALAPWPASAAPRPGEYGQTLVFETTLPAEQVANLERELDPVVPGPDQAGSPFLADHLGDACLGGARQRPERVPVEVDQPRVVAYQAVSKTGQRVGRVKTLGMGPVGGKRRHGPNPTGG